MTACSFKSFIHWSIHPSIHPFIYPLVHPSMTNPFLDPSVFIHSFWPSVHSFICILFHCEALWTGYTTVSLIKNILKSRLFVEKSRLSDSWIQGNAMGPFERRWSKISRRRLSEPSTSWFWKGWTVMERIPLISQSNARKRCCSLRMRSVCSMLPVTPALSFSISCRKKFHMIQNTCSETVGYVCTLLSCSQEWFWNSWWSAGACGHSHHYCSVALYCMCVDHSKLCRLFTRQGGCTKRS